MMVTVTLRENLGPPMPKQNDDSSSGRPRTVQVLPEGYREPHSEVGSLSPAERLAGFHWWLQYHL